MKELLITENLYESIYNENLETIDLFFKKDSLNIWIRNIEVDISMDEFFLDYQENIDYLIEKGGCISMYIKHDFAVDQRKIESEKAELEKHLEKCLRNGFSNCLDSLLNVTENDARKLAQKYCNNEIYIYTESEWLEYLNECLYDYPEDVLIWLDLWNSYLKSKKHIILDIVSSNSQMYI